MKKVYFTVEIVINVDEDDDMTEISDIEDIQDILRRTDKWNILDITDTTHESV